MHYLPLPRTVLPAVTVVTVFVVIWLAWGSWQNSTAPNWEDS